MKKQLNMNKTTAMKNTGTICAMMAFAMLVAVEPAFAQGVEKIDSFLENVLSILRGASIAVVTIAIMWAGYKYLFKHADLAEVGKILAGGLLIGGAAELARFLLG